MKIHILWATIRPNAFVTMHKIWLERATDKNNIITYVAVNSEADANVVKQVLSKNDEVVVVTTDRRGVCYPSYMLSKDLEGENDDIVILASDDYLPPNNWNSYLKEKLYNREGGILINDGYQAIDFSNMADPIIGLPILTFGCLEKLNKIIYNPYYNHLCSDAELYINLKELGLLIDERSMDNVIFEHLHWSSRKRQADLNDQSYYDNFENDKKTWEARKKMTLEERLKYETKN
jgi:hypothetical protein